MFRNDETDSLLNSFLENSSHTNQKLGIDKTIQHFPGYTSHVLHLPTLPQLMSDHRLDHLKAPCVKRAIPSTSLGYHAHPPTNPTS